MWAVFVGILKPGVRENPDEYDNRPFDMFVSYYDTGIYRLSGELANKHGPSKQMDWGSTLYIVDKAGLGELLSPEARVVQILPAEEGVREEAELLPPIKMKEIPKEEWYGVLEVECY